MPSSVDRLRRLSAGGVRSIPSWMRPPEQYQVMGELPNLTAATMQNWLTQTPQHAALARDLTAATEAAGPAGIGGAWAEPGLQSVFRQQLEGGMSPAEREAQIGRIRTGFNAAVRGLAGRGFKPGEIGMRAQGALPGLGTALAQAEAERARAGRESLVEAGRTAGTVLPYAAEAARGRQEAFGETLGALRAGSQPQLRPLRGGLIGRRGY